MRVEEAFDWNWCCANGRMWIENGCASKVSCSGSLSHSDKEVYCQAKIFKRSIKFNLEWMMRAPIRSPSLAHLLPPLRDVPILLLRLRTSQRRKMENSYRVSTNDFHSWESYIACLFCLFRSPFNSIHASRSIVARITRQHQFTTAMWWR